jgi:predicted RNase H-like HicB family nuclease
MTSHFKVILQKEEDGGYSVFVPALPGCASQGDTEQEAMVNIKEAIDLYLESLKEDHLPIPGGDFILRDVEVTV